MFKLQPVRGTHDLLSDELQKHNYVVNVMREWSERYGCGEIATPIFEFSEVFKRTLGVTSDVVNKEMYTFEDRGGDEITLRPEFTAGIARALISGGLSNQLPLRYFAYGPAFRYERPQRGRLRQFHQINVEFLGIPDPGADIEVICLADDILETLGLRDKTVLEINSLGDHSSRAAYREKLVDYFNDYRGNLSEESLARLERNPLRILDSKNEGDRKLIINAPKISDSLNQMSAEFFLEVCSSLDTLGIHYKHNPTLVRGLDYYTHTTFEFTTAALGAQSAVIAGGRYDGLVETMGGSPTPGIGWAGGIERLSMLLDTELPIFRPIAVIPVGSLAEKKAMLIARELRGDGFKIDTDFSGSLKKRLKRADKLFACAAIIIGDDELEKDVAIIRDLDSGEQIEVSIQNLSQDLVRFKN